MLDFRDIEKEAREIWEKKDKEIKKAVSYDPKKKLFSFLEGPPTANAPPALHHLEVRTFKDIICKFKYMQGFSVPRKGGWDCHGLPVEVQVEKKLGLNSKKEILSYGEEKFINKCKASVFSNISEWNKSTEELNYWIDLENPYRTLDNNYVESVWWGLKELYKKKLLYESHKVVPFCPRCQTPLSSHEVAQGYKEISEDSVIVKFKLKDSKENAYLLVWTTTPWTLPSNLAIAVNPDLKYVYLNHNEFIYVLARHLAERYFQNPKIIKEISGRELVGNGYEPLFDYFKDLESDGAFKIIGGDFVTTEDGTGIVHMAPAFGEVDYDACKYNKIPFVKPIDENGKFTSEVPDFEGQFIKNSDKAIISKLDNEDKLFKVIRYSHEYPFCWRCSTPLMYYAIKSWFIRVTAVKDKLVNLNKKINWYPNNIKEGRFGDWLVGIKDWNLSRFKFWGTPLPIWRCECGEEKIIGSVKELKKESIKKFKNYDLHRPWIDNIKLKCRCGKEMKRITDVIDCWYDSGSSTFAQFHYPFENKKEFEKRFPYDFISEAIDQTRGWFYTLHAISTMLFEDIAYKNVICAGLLVDENGEKMSKTKGNIISPRQVIDDVGVDAIRLQFCTTDPGNQKRFSVNMVKENVLPFFNVLYNCKQYYEQIEDKKLKSKNSEDKWILSRLNSLIKKSTEDLENYAIDKALLSIMDFVVNDFSRAYIKMTRERDDTRDIIGEVLEKVSLLSAPYAPYTSEYIYQIFKKGNSVHLSSWPKTNKKMINPRLETQIGIILKIIEKGLFARDKARIGLKWPLRYAKIITPNFSSDKKEIKELGELIKSQLNLKDIGILKKDCDEISLELDTKMTAELEAEGYAREISRKVQVARKSVGFVKTDKIRLGLILPNKIKALIKNQLEFIKERTNSNSIALDNIKESDFKHKSEGKIKGNGIKILLSKI